MMGFSGVPDWRCYATAEEVKRHEEIVKAEVDFNNMLLDGFSKISENPRVDITGIASDVGGAWLWVFCGGVDYRVDVKKIKDRDLRVGDTIRVRGKFVVPPTIIEGQQGEDIAIYDKIFDAKVKIIKRRHPA
jgi:hypothetical protein